jgi:hypothetical protein
MLEPHELHGRLLLGRTTYVRAKRRSAQPRCPSPREAQGCPGKGMRLQICTSRLAFIVMAGLVQACPGHPRLACDARKTWMPGTRQHKAGHDDCELQCGLQRLGSVAAEIFPGQPCAKRGEGGGPVASATGRVRCSLRRQISLAFTAHLTRSLRSHQQPGRPLCGRPRLGSIAKRSNGRFRLPLGSWVGRWSFTAFSTGAGTCRACCIAGWFAD